jgi:hypothetical protein
MQCSIEKLVTTKRVCWESMWAPPTTWSSTSAWFCFESPQCLISTISLMWDSMVERIWHCVTLIFTKSIPYSSLTHILYDRCDHRRTLCTLYYHLWMTIKSALELHNTCTCSVQFGIRIGIPVPITSAPQVLHIAASIKLLIQRQEIFGST